MKIRSDGTARISQNIRQPRLLLCIGIMVGAMIIIQQGKN